MTTRMQSQGQPKKQKPTFVFLRGGEPKGKPNKTEPNKTSQERKTCFLKWLGPQRPKHLQGRMVWGHLGGAFWRPRSGLPPGQRPQRPAAGWSDPRGPSKAEIWTYRVEIPVRVSGLTCKSSMLFLETHQFCPKGCGDPETRLVRGGGGG